MRFDGAVRMSAAPWVSFADIGAVECNGGSWFDCGQGLVLFPGLQPVPVGSPWLSAGIAAGWFLRLSGGFSLVSDRVEGPRSF